MIPFARPQGLGLGLEGVDLALGDAGRPMLAEQRVRLFDSQLPLFGEAVYDLAGYAKFSGCLGDAHIFLHTIHYNTTDRNCTRNSADSCEIVTDVVLYT